MVNTWQPDPLLRKKNSAISPVTAPIVPKATTVAFAPDELPVSPSNPGASLFAKSVKKLRGLFDPPERVWSLASLAKVGITVLK